MSESTARREIVHEVAKDVEAPAEGELEDTVTSASYRFPGGKLGKLSSADKTPLVVSVRALVSQYLRY